MKNVFKLNKGDKPYNLRYYKAENLELSYYGFEEGYKKLWDAFAKSRRVEKSEKIKRILTYFEIDFKDCNDCFEINTYSLVYLYFVIWLLNFWISLEKIKKHYKALLESWKKYHYWKYLYGFYIYQVMAWYQVNFYIHKDFCLLLTSREFNGLKWLNWKDNHLIIINLNHILSLVFNKDYPSKKDSAFHLNKEEQALLFELNFGMYDKDEIRVKMKDWKIKELEILGTEKDLSKIQNLEDSILHWEIAKKKYKGKTKYLKIKEIKNLENEVDNE